MSNSKYNFWTWLIAIILAIYLFWQWQNGHGMGSAAGCVGFSQANIAITDTQVLWRAMEYAATFGFTLFLHAEEPFLAANGVAHDGEVATRLGLKGIPSAAEALALASILRIAQETGAKVHISRLSTAEGVAMIRAAKAQGLSLIHI